jgi:hypothetical protein
MAVESKPLYRINEIMNTEGIMRLAILEDFFRAKAQRFSRMAEWVPLTMRQPSADK